MLPVGVGIGSAAAVLLYAGFVLVLLDRSSLLPVFGGGTFGVAATWVLVAFLACGVVRNAISRSTPERMTMARACAVLAGCALVIALGA